tara:strand:+ start:3583 stop:4143 length:561 start_codon:yes stop_codon:yes gene_type:complete
MSSVLYYSKYCENCQKLLYELGKTNISKQIHFLSIDKRVNKNSKVYLVLDNGCEVFLPPNITRVPTLLLLNKGNKIIVGDDVLNYFRPQLTQQKVKATRHNMEPMAFSMYEMGTSMSDNYSYLDQSNESMSAKGDGGLRQMHSFVTLNFDDKINTPPEDYEPDKVGNVDLGKLQAQRDSEVSMPSQ